MIIFTGLQYNSSFFDDYNNLMKRRQKYVDSEVLRLSDPYVPMRTGMLKKSGISGTVIGSGKIEYTAPYARRQYYENFGKGVEGLNNPNSKGLRGKYWFERMKADHKDEMRVFFLRYYISAQKNQAEKLSKNGKMNFIRKIKIS